MTNFKLRTLSKGCPLSSLIIKPIVVGMYTSIFNELELSFLVKEKCAYYIRSQVNYLLGHFQSILSTSEWYIELEVLDITVQF